MVSADVSVLHGVGVCGHSERYIHLNTVQRFIMYINNNINTSFSRCQETSRHLFAQAVERQQRGSTETEVVHTQPWPNVSRENVLYGLSL